MEDVESENEKRDQVTGVVVDAEAEADEKKPRPRSLHRKASSASFRNCVSKPPEKETCFVDTKGNLKFVNFIVRYPTPVFCFMIILCIASVFILGALLDENPITEDTNSYDMKDVRSVAYDSLRLAKEELEDAYYDSRRLSKRGDSRLQEDRADETYWIYDAKSDSGLWTADGIREMREAESIVLENENYPQFCQLEYNDTASDASAACMKPFSALNIFYASEWDTVLVDEIITNLTSEATSVERLNNLTKCISNEFRGDGCEYAPAELSQFKELNENIDTVIGKWDGQGEFNDTNLDQVIEFIAYMNELFSRKESVIFYVDKNFGLDNQVNMHSRSRLFWGKLLTGTETDEESATKLKEFILENLYVDLEKAQKGGKVLNAYYFMGNLIWDIILIILALDGTLALASFVLVFIYLRFMLGSWFLTCVGMFEIVMSLPLAWITFSYIFQIKYFSSLNVLCIFIVMAIGADDIFVFMDAYKQSATIGASEDVLSSLETRMSWIYRRSGSAMLLTSITTCCAFLCTLLSPLAFNASFGIFAALVILFDYILVMSLFCTATVIYHNRFETKRGCCNCSCSPCEPSSTSAALQKVQEGCDFERDWIGRFFEDKIGPWILKCHNRIIVGTLLLIWIVLSIVYAAQLEPTTAAEEFLHENHPLQIGLTILGSEFQKTREDVTSKIHFVWGLSDVNRDGVNQLLDPDFVGKASFDDNFFFSETCQTAILKVCDDVESNQYPELDNFVRRRETGSLSVDCVIENLGEYKLNGCEATNSAINNQFDRNSAWQIDSDNVTSTVDSFLKTCSVDYDYTNILGFNGADVQYAGFSLESNRLDPDNVLPETEVREIYDTMIAFAEGLDEVKEACGTSATMTDLDQKFITMNNQYLYRRSSLSGSLVGLIFAFIVLFASTRKLHLSLFATLSITCVLFGVIGATVMLGWSLGMIEAILISILAGFSVDYVIHLAHAYHHASGTVEERIQAAYGNMGISVFSGMLTSVIASIPLFFCTITFFSKFGTFLCLTIVLSWIFANFGFITLLATFKISMDKKWI